MDSFHAGWSFFFVAEREPEGAVEGGAFGTVGSVEETNEAVGLVDGVSDLDFGQRARSVGRSFPALDDRTTLLPQVCILCVWPAGTSASLTTSTSRLGAPG